MKNVLGQMFDVRHHIAARIFVAVFSSLFVVMLVFLISFYTMGRNQTVKTIEQNARILLDRAHSELAATLSEVEELSSFLISNEDVSNYLYGSGTQPPTLRWFESYNETLKLMRHYVVGRSKTIIGMAVLKNSGESCLTGTLQAPVLSRDFSPTQSELVTLCEYPYVVRVLSAGGEDKVMIVTQLARDFWMQVYGKNVLDGHVLRVYTSDGQQVFSAGDSALQSGQALKRADEAFLAAGEDSLTTGGGLVLADKESVTGLTCMVYVPPRTVDASLVPLNRQVLALLFILLVSAFALSRGLSLGITRSVKILKKNVKRIGQGRYDDLVALNSRDELGELGQTMQHLAGRINQLISDINQREMKKREMELDILRAQVSPHFLYNALNSISYLSALQGAENIERLSASLIDLLQAALQPSHVLVGLEKEISYVYSYYEIMRYRFIYGVSFEIEVAPEVYRAQVIRMLLQPIVENAFIHGIGPRQRDGVIRIAAAREKDDLVIRVTDNGGGMPKEKIDHALAQVSNSDPMRFSGIGIRNVQDRLRLQFGEAYGLSIASQVGAYTCVTLRMPLIEKEEAAGEDSAG